MYRTAVVLVMAFTLAMAPSLGAQAKQKDPVLQQYLKDQFDQLNSKLTQLNDRLTATAAKLDQLDQKQTALDSELRNQQNISKSIDTSLSTLRLSSQQDLFSLKTDLAQARQDVAAVADLVRRSSAAASAALTPPAAVAPPKPAEAPSAPTPVLEGYITAVDADELTINLGSSAGVKPGVQLNVYKAADPRTTVAVAEITQVIDTNNSRAKVIFVKPDSRLEFSDSVRLK